MKLLKYLFLLIRIYNFTQFFRIFYFNVLVS